jgi:CRISPR/Cas system CSM-associated protein Csm5 (group 7 of RAMP superfamily)
MNEAVVVLIGFGAGILTMTVISLYKWVFNIWNSGFG